MIAYLKLFRADVAVIAYGGYLAGAHIARGLALEDFFIAFLITAISVIGFPYSVWPFRLKVRQPLSVLGVNADLVHSVYVCACRPPKHIL